MSDKDIKISLISYNALLDIGFPIKLFFVNLTVLHKRSWREPSFNFRVPWGILLLHLVYSEYLSKKKERREF